MEFNASQQYNRASNRSFTIAPHQSHDAAQMMYPYGSIPLQPSHLQALQQPDQFQPPTSWPADQPYNGNTAYFEPNQSSQHRGNGFQIQGIDAPQMNLPSQSAVVTPGLDDFSLHNTSSQADFFQGSMIDTSSWAQKTCADMGLSHLDSDVAEYPRDFNSHDENAPIIDLRQYSGLEGENDTPNYALNMHRRMSESSFSMSSTGGGNFAEFPAFEDVSLSEGISYASDCDAWSSTYEPAPDLLSPLASPRRTQHEPLRGSRSRASPAPHTSMRSSPYTMDSSRNKRWSTGTYAPTSTPSGSRNVSNTHDRFATYGRRINPHHSMPVYSSAMINNLNYQLQSQNILYSQPQSQPQPQPLQSNASSLFAVQDHQQQQQFPLEVPRPVPSQNFFPLLQSNADSNQIACSSQFADLSDPPDLYSSLHNEPSDPPEEDMNPEDPELVPHEQDLRFPGDLYTPKWVRGHKNKREGWCGLCKPGRWLVLKNSAFWYDKSFTHGVSATTGAAFHGPQETRRTEGNPDVWEGLCGSCGQWIALVSIKKKGTTWFRHAYKCHTHPKVKDGAKRRRETSHQARNRATSSTKAANDHAATPSRKQDQIPEDHAVPTTESQTPSTCCSHAPAASTPYDLAAYQHAIATTQAQLLGLSADATSDDRTVSSFEDFVGMR